MDIMLLFTEICTYIHTYICMFKFYNCKIYRYCYLIHTYNVYVFGIVVSRKSKMLLLIDEYNF